MSSFPPMFEAMYSIEFFTALLARSCLGLGSRCAVIETSPKPDFSHFANENDDVDEILKRVLVRVKV